MYLVTSRQCHFVIVARKTASGEVVRECDEVSAVLHAKKCTR